MGPDTPTTRAAGAPASDYGLRLIPEQIPPSRKRRSLPLAGLEWGEFFLRLAQGPLRPRLVPMPVLVPVLVPVTVRHRPGPART